MNLTNLSAYDSLDLHRTDFESFCARFNVDADKLLSHPRFHFDDAKIYGKSILLNKSEDNAPFVKVNRNFVDPQGNTHPNIFITTKGGTGDKGTFKCWDYFTALKNNSSVKFGSKFTPNAISEAESQRREEKARQAAQQEQQQNEKKCRQFERWKAEHLAAPRSGGSLIETHKDVIKHFGENNASRVANYSTSLFFNKTSLHLEVHPMTVTRLTDNRGDCLSIGAVSEIDGEIEFFQRIYDRNIGAPDIAKAI